MAIQPTTLKRYKKVQAEFARLSAIPSGIKVRGVNTPKYSIKQCIQKTADKCDYSFTQVEKILKKQLD